MGWGVVWAHMDHDLSMVSANLACTLAKALLVASLTRSSMVGKSFASLGSIDTLVISTTQSDQ